MIGADKDIVLILLKQMCMLAVAGVAFFYGDSMTWHCNLKSLVKLPPLRVTNFRGSQTTKLRGD